ncbi:MAG: Glu-tRNA(Gln) amidotransferase subunit GatE [Candidatus Bathyarchaeia archaeon]
MMDYGEMGLKVGIEIHCQLDTRHKLFCKCPAELATGAPDLHFVRRLRPTQSELGEVDPAALFEFQRGRIIEYAADTANSCLVEADEEPPHDIDEEAVEIALIIASLLKARPVDAVHVMRKVVIDGSSTTGFQRTAAIALGGEVEVGSKPIPIQHVSLEEDASRKIAESEAAVSYRIDRLCIPLVEIATAPVIQSPQEAQEVASAIGRILKATRRVKRGIGTIRQDLNISMPQGALVEIKGVQKLELIGRVVELEAQRQISLIQVRDELIKRGLKEDELQPIFKNLTPIFYGTGSKVIKEGLERGGVVLGVRLPKFRGLLGMELAPGVRLGTELSWYAVFYGGVRGIFHTDELPRYGITEEEKWRALQELGAGESDAAVLVCDLASKAENALKAVVDRAKAAFSRIPEETRAATEDGASRYMRPRPGAARMYPETDVPPFIIDEERLKRVDENLPEMPEVLLSRITNAHGINRKLAAQLLDSDYLPLFEELTSFTKVAPSFIATVLTETLKSLERKGARLENLRESHLRALFHLIDSRKTAKESAETVVEWLCIHPDRSPEEAIEALNLKMLSPQDLEKEIDQIVLKNKGLVDRQGEKAAGKLVGIAMSVLRGRADAEDVMKVVKEKLK